MDSTMRPRWAVPYSGCAFEKLATGLSNTQTPSHAPIPTHTHAPKPASTLTRDKFNILQINVCGLQPRVTELAKMLSEKNVQIALLQETILPRQDINITGYAKYPCQCTNKCQGIMTLVRNDVQAIVTNLSSSDFDI